MDKNTLNFGFVKDENNLQLNKVFKNDNKLKEIHIDIYPENPLVSSSVPFMLLLRTIGKKIIISNDNERLILKKNIDGYETHFINVLLSEIKESYFMYDSVYSEFILNIQNIWYRITVRK